MGLSDAQDATASSIARSTAAIRVRAWVIDSLSWFGAWSAQAFGGARGLDEPVRELGEFVVAGAPPPEAVLAAAVDADGRPLEVVRIPAPVLTPDEGGQPVDWSYVNHLVCNGGIVACTFDDPNDERALQVLREAYPGREVVGVDARPLYDRGGGIHCITQQQPAVPRLPVSEETR